MRSIVTTMSRALLAAVVFTLPVAAQDFDPFADPGGAGGLPNSNASESALIAEVDMIAPGATFTVAIKLTHQDHWHSYYINPGFVGDPLKLNWTLPEGFSAGPIQWPTPERIAMAGFTLYGYEGTNYFLVDITPPGNLAPDSSVTLRADAAWQTCEEQCINETATLDLTLKTGATASPNAAVATEFKTARERQPIVSDSWKVSLEIESEEFLLTLKPTADDLPALKDVYFFSTTQQTDAEKEQTLVEADGSYVLTVPRKELPDMTALTGILSSESGWLKGNSSKGLLVSLPLGGDGVAAAPPAAREKLGTSSETSLLKILGLAFLGGIILNLMPCVFPVLGLKIMGFVEQSGEDPKKIRMHGMVFAAGLMVSLWIVAGILIGLIVSGQHLGWGFQLNDSRFLAGMIILLFILGLNLVGVFEIGTSLTGVGSDLQRKKGYSGSFFTGVLTTLVATPCTGPFLGAAMGFALQQPAYISLIVFTALGLGIAFPYVLLAFNPKLLKKLPRPGAWMETMKVALSFPLFLWVVYLLNGFGAQTGRGGIVWLLTALLVVAVACWIYGHWNKPHLKARVRMISKVAALLFLGVGFYTASYALAKRPEGGESNVTKLGELEAVKWKPDIVAELQAEGHIVFVDYTADT